MDSFQKRIETPIFYLGKLILKKKTKFQASGLIYDCGLLWKKNALQFGNSSNKVLLTDI